jgi:hypothetical protein
VVGSAACADPTIRKDAARVCAARRQTTFRME